MTRRRINTLLPFLSAQLNTRDDSQRRILTNIAWLFADRSLRMAAGLVLGVLVARYLGPEQFGIYSFVIASVALLSPLATLGLDAVVIRDIVQNPGSKNEILGTAFVLKLTAGICTMALAIGGASFLHLDDQLTLPLVGLLSAGLVFSAFDTIDFWFQSQVQSKYTVWAKNIAFAVVAVARLGLIHLRAPLLAFGVAGLAETALGALGLVVAYYAKGERLGAWRPTLRQTLPLLKESWPLLFSSVSIMIYMKIDQLMLGSMLGSEAVGLYAAATRVSEVWYFIPIAITSSVFPSIVQAKKTSEPLYYRALQRLFALMSALALGIAIPVTALSGTLIVVLFGEPYATAGTILAIHIWAGLFVFLGVAQGPWNITEGLTKLSLQRTLIGAIANVLLNFALIPPYSGLGAAVATVVSYGLSAFLSNAFDRRTRHIFIMQARSILFSKYLAT